jgi:hypothetical protein
MRLFPAVRESAPDTEIVASGLSCRQQIQHATGRKAKHFLELMAATLEEEPMHYELESGDKPDAQ